MNEPLQTIIPGVFVAVFIAFDVVVYKLWKQTDNSTDRAAWDSGYHAFMAFSGFLIGLPLVGTVGSVAWLISRIMVHLG
jgi:hypothetical protein